MSLAYLPHLARCVSPERMSSPLGVVNGLRHQHQGWFVDSNPHLFARCEDSCHPEEAEVDRGASWSYSNDSNTVFSKPNTVFHGPTSHTRFSPLTFRTFNSART